MSSDQPDVHMLTLVFNETIENASLDKKRAALFSLIGIVENSNMPEQASENDVHLTDAVMPFFSQTNAVDVSFAWTVSTNKIMAEHYYSLRTKGFIGKTSEGVYIL